MSTQSYCLIDIIVCCVKKNRFTVLRYDGGHAEGAVTVVSAGKAAESYNGLMRSGETCMKVCYTGDDVAERQVARRALQRVTRHR